VDPICTFLFAFLVLLTTRAILRDISDILMERVPRAHDAADIQEGLEKVKLLDPPPFWYWPPTPTVQPLRVVQPDEVCEVGSSTPGLSHGDLGTFPGGGPTEKIVP